MNAQGRYAASDRSFSRSVESAVVRGVLLIAFAILIGFVLLRWGYRDNSVTQVQPDPTVTVAPGSDQETTSTLSITTIAAPTDDPEPGVTSTTTTSAPVQVDDPEDVSVAVLNGTTTTGLAGRRMDVLKAMNYVAQAFNAASNTTQQSGVYYTPGFADEAREVAIALNAAPGDVVAAAPSDPTSLALERSRSLVGDYDVFVVLGTDGVLG